MLKLTNSLLLQLNEALALMLDLKLQAKQAHWNVKGDNFIALHQLFDAVATEADGHADMLAERVVQLGGIAKGTLQDIASGSTLKAYSNSMEQNTLHVDALSESMKICADAARKLIDVSAESGDAVTADLLTGIARALDKQYWFVSAHK